MHLIAPLCVGVAGAGNGYVRLLKRGASASATWYPDFEATSSNASGANIPLDGNGGATIYVNELVDVRAYNAAGTLVRSFTAGDAAPNIEVISPSATGTAYAGGATGAGKPTTLQAFVDKLFTSFGSTDFKVLFGGASTPLQTALAGLPTYINVKSPTYGAVGNGVADDTAAITAAIAAAGSSGTLFFPAGNYLITSGLTVNPGVNFLGVGLSIIICSHATQNALTFTGDGNVLENMAVQISGTGSGDVLRLSTGGARVTLRSCYLQSYSGSCFATPAAGIGTHTKMLAYDTHFFKGFSGQPAVSAVFSDNGAQLGLFGCELHLGLAFASVNDSLVRVSYGSIVGCKFEMSTNASGTAYGVRAPAVEIANRPIIVSGCSFYATGAGGTINLLGQGATNSILDAGNEFGVTGTIYSGAPTAATSAGAALSVQQATTAAGWAAGAVTLAYDTYSHYTLQASANFAALNPAITAANLAAGRRITYTIVNKSGGGAIPLPPNAGIPNMYDSAVGFPMTLIANNNATTLEFLIIILNGTKYALCTHLMQNYGPV